jgi:tetratricopeptide (TPR) repeat protein
MINLGACLSENGNRETAIETFETVLQKKPHYADIRMQLGRLYAQKEDHKQAILAFKAALHINPQLQAAKQELKLLRHKLGWETDVI